MAKSKWLNSYGSIPKLSDSNRVTSTINASDLLGTTDKDGNPVVAKIPNAYGPGQQIQDQNAGSWFPRTEVLRIMKSIRVCVENPDIQAFFVAFVGAAGSYTWDRHKTHFDLDVDIKDIDGCRNIYPGHVHVTGYAFDGLLAYGTETNDTLTGENSCAIAEGSSNAFVPPFGYGPPILYRDFVAPGGNSGANLEWSIIKDDYPPRQPISLDNGYPIITTYSTGADSGAGIDLPNWIGDVTVDGRVVASNPVSYPPDDFSINEGYSPPPVIDYTAYVPNWQACLDELQSLVTSIQSPNNDGSGKTLLQIPTYDLIFQSPSLPFGAFPAYLIPNISTPYFLTCAWTFLVIAQPVSLTDGLNFDQWISLTKAQKNNWAGRRVMVCVDTKYLEACGIGMVPGLIADTISAVSDFCSALQDCGFIFGGEVDFTTILDTEFYNTLFNDIMMFFSTLPVSMPRGPYDGIDPSLLTGDS